MSNRVPIESKIYLISGKGGVGKSSVAAALGQNFAKKGLRTLIVELGENSYFNYLFAKKHKGKFILRI